MDKNQKIKCDVCSCTYNNTAKEICELEEIKVSACPGCTTGNPEDESMCASYKCDCETQNN